MAKVKLKRAFLIGGKFYTSGVQEIADEKLKHPHFVRYIKLGLVVAPENEELEKIESGDERMKRIAAKEKDLAAKQKELLILLRCADATRTLLPSRFSPGANFNASGT